MGIPVQMRTHRELGLSLEAFDTDGVIQAVGKRQVLLEADLGGGDSTSQRRRRHGGPQSRTTDASQSKSRHDWTEKSALSYFVTGKTK